MYLIKLNYLKFIAIAILLAGNLAYAEDTPKPIQEMLQSGAQIFKEFPAASQLKGWIIVKDHRYTIVYSTPDNKTLLAGDLIDEDGNNLTEKYADLYLPKRDLAPLYDKLEKSAFISEGTQGAPKSVIYVFFDPNCPFCHFAWKALQPYEAVGLQVRWIPVAYLMETSTGKAAAILQAGDKLAAFRDNEMNYSLANHSGGIKPAKPTAATNKLLQSNSELMHAFGITGTPALVWKDAAGKVQMKGGLPRLHELPAITGLPEQAIDDPELARFK
jgi:thiol:disulfide interchange protein DsbG